MTGNPVTVYSRPGCHLCELMAEQLEPLCRAAGLSLRMVDVDANREWRDRFGLRIPVACVGEEELTGWPMDPQRVLRRLRVLAAGHPGRTGQGQQSPEPDRGA